MYGRLWAIGQDRATPCTVTYRDTRLVARDGDVSIGAGNLGHAGGTRAVGPVARRSGG